MKKLILYLLSVLSISLATSCNLLQEIIDYDDSNEDENIESLQSDYFVSENFVDGLDAIYSNKGYIAFYGFENIQVYPGHSSEERVIYLGRIIGEEFMIEDAMVIVVDSTNFPIRMAYKNVNTIFSKIDDEHVNCAVYTSQTGEWLEFNNISYDGYESKHNNSTRALASDGYSEFGWSDVIGGIDILHSLCKGIRSALDKDQLGVLESNIDVFGNLQPNDEVGLGIDVSLAIGEGKNIKGNLLTSIGSYLIEKYEKFVEEQLGRVYISIDDLKRIDATTCEVFYTIGGLNNNGIKFGESNMMLSKESKPIDYQKVNTINHSGSKIFSNLSTGRYTIEFYVYSSKYYNVLYDVKYTFTMFELGVDHYEINPNPEYNDGKVRFDIMVFLKGNAKELNNWINQGTEFGYYVYYANAIPDYKKVTNFSTIFENTPLTYDLDIEREGFFEENINYTTFEARAVDYHIGAYVVVDGKIMTYDEQEMELIYCEHPEVETGEYVSVSPTKVNVKGEFKNCLFWNAIRGIEYVAESESNPKSLVLGANMEDGAHQFHLEDLKPNTTYQYRAYYEVNGIREYGEPMEFKTEPLNLTIDSIFYNDDYYYYTKDNNGYVAYNLTAKISGNTDDIGECQSCGIYLWNSEKNESYIWHEGLSGAYNNTPIKMFIGVGESAFDKRDDSRYYAESTKYYFGVYVQFNDGSYYMSEPVQCKFIYDRKPKYRYTYVGPISVSVAGSKENEDGETVIEYNAKHAYSYFYEGAFWIDYIQWWCDGSWHFTNTGEKYNEPSTLTGEMVNAYDATRSLHYWSNTDMYHSVWCVITTKIGETLYSNSLLYGGTPENPTVSIGGTRLSSSMSNARLLIDNNVGSGKGGSINFLPENRTLKKCDIIEIEDLEILYK